MTITLLVTARIICGVIIGLFGVGKLVAGRAATAHMWRPANFSDRAMIAAVVSLSILEVGDLGILGLGGLSAWLVCAIVIPQGMIVTLYGAASLVSVGDCGCSGIRHAERKAVRDARLELICRNILLFGIGVVGATMAPAVWLVKDPAPALLVLASLPLLVLAFALCWRAIVSGTSPRSTSIRRRDMLFDRLAYHLQ